MINNNLFDYKVLKSVLYIIAKFATVSSVGVEHWSSLMLD